MSGIQVASSHVVGQIIQAVYPLPGGFDGAPLAVSAVSAQTVAKATNEAFYIYSNTPIHINIGNNPTATLNDPPIPSNTPMVFAISQGMKIAVVKMAGFADGSCWIHNLKVRP